MESPPGSSRITQTSRSSTVVGAWSAAVIICLAAAACGHPGYATCLDEAHKAVGVHVQDADTGAPVCDAVVVIHSGVYSESLPVRNDPADDGAPGCVYAGAYERPGTYEVDVSRAGYASATTTGVVVPLDSCGKVVPQTLVITLTHSP